MTEQDLEQLFHNSKEKYTLKTELSETYHKHTKNYNRDFTTTDFLRIHNDIDKMLTGLPLEYL